MANFTASEEPIVSPSHYPSFCTHHKRLRLISALLSAKLSSFLVGFARLFRRISLLTQSPHCYSNSFHEGVLVDKLFKSKEFILSSDYN